MPVITAVESLAGNEGIYHLINEDESGSVCGAVQINNFIGKQALNVLTREAAEEQDLRACKHCLRLTGEQ